MRDQHVILKAEHRERNNVNPIRACTPAPTTRGSTWPWHRRPPV